MNQTEPNALPGGIAKSISKETLATLPLGRYTGEVIMVSSATDLATAVADLRDETAVGFDTETRPAFRKGESHLPCLAQVATGRAVYLFRLHEGAVLDALAGMLGDARITKAGIGLADDLRTLKKVFAFEPDGMLDLGNVAKRHGLEQSGLRNLAGLFLGIRIPKGAKTSNWANAHLTPAQITYAATDAWICRELFLKFSAMDLLPRAQA